MTAPNVALLPVDLADPEGHSWLVAFLTTNRFPFHVTSAPTREGVERRIADGDFGCSTRSARSRERERSRPMTTPAGG